jgi:hypothetical protein
MVASRWPLRLDFLAAAIKRSIYVGVTAVTTVAPGCPVTPLMTLAKVGFTPVTHVSAEAEANTAAFRLTKLTAKRRGRPVMRLSLHQSMPRPSRSA